MSGVDGAMPLAVRMQIRKELLDQDDRFIQNIPKVELHVHIEGTLSPELRWELAQRNGMTLKIERTGVVHESLEHLRTFYEVPEAREGHSFDDDEERFTFFEAYYGGFEVLRTEQDFYDLAMNYFTQAASMRVRYCEPFFDPQGHTRRGVSWDTMMGGLCRAREAAKRELGVSAEHYIKRTSSSWCRSANSWTHRSARTGSCAFFATCLPNQQWSITRLPYIIAML